VPIAFRLLTAFRLENLRTKFVKPFSKVTESLGSAMKMLLSYMARTVQP
jgi:hypothetical protein